jgi:hypothetical protein
MGWLRRLFTGLHLKVNEAKSAVDLATRRKVLGYSFWLGPGGVVKRRVARKAQDKLKERVRHTTRRSGGRSLSQVVQELRSYLPGWKAYFRLADTPKALATLDEWIRHRLRALQLKHWKRGRTTFRQLRQLGLSQDEAARVAACTRSWWRNSALLLNKALPIRFFDELGLPRLAT